MKMLQKVIQLVKHAKNKKIRLAFGGRGIKKEVTFFYCGLIGRGLITVLYLLQVKSLYVVDIHEFSVKSTI
jgi:hypothetical protein